MILQPNLILQKRNWYHHHQQQQSSPNVFLVWKKNHLHCQNSDNRARVESCEGILSVYETPPRKQESCDISVFLKCPFVCLPGIADRNDFSSEYSLQLAALTCLDSYHGFCFTLLAY